MINTSLDLQFEADETTTKQAQQLLENVLQYMPSTEVEFVSQAIQLARETCEGIRGERAIPPLEHALAVATILAQIMHIDAVGVASGLVFEAVDSDLLSLEDVETTARDSCRASGGKYVASEHTGTKKACWSSIDYS